MLNEKQIATVHLWVQHPTASFAKIAAMAEIGDTTFYRWRQDEEFMKLYKELCQDKFAALEAKAVQKLDEALDNNNFQAVKYTLDSLGYKPTEKVEAVVDNDLTITVGYCDE